VIKLLDQAGDRVKLHYIEDDSEEVTGINRDQWIQWLVSQTLNNDMKIWANLDEENKISSYLVAYDCVDRPVADHVYIVYFWADNDQSVNKELFEKVKDWARLVGADSLQTSTVHPEDFVAYGFSKSKEVSMELEI